MADGTLPVGITFTTTGNAEAAAAMAALGTAAAETSAQFDAAAISAKAMADAVTGAQALSQLGIKAKSSGVVNTEGQGLVTVAQEEQATAQSILNKLGLEAVAVTQEQTAATARLAAAATEAAVAETRQAEATAAATSSSWAAGMEQINASFAAHRSMVAGMQRLHEDWAKSQAGVTEGGRALEEETKSETSAFGGMWTQLLAVVAALEAYNKAKEFISTGIDFNAAIESARLGIAASVNAMATLTDAEGKALEGQQKFGAATALADDQIQKLFADSARTSTTVQQLVTTYQAAIAVGINAGASLDQIRRLTTDAALAAGALNIPYTQLSVTLVQLLEGHTRVTNRLSQALGINQHDLATWKEKGTLVDELLSRFGQYEALSDRIQSTWRGIASNIKEFFQQFSGAATSSAFATLETGVKGALGQVFDFKTGQLGENIQGAADLMREALGGAATLVVSLVESMVRGMERLGTWFQNNRAEAEKMGRDFLEMVTNTGRILLNIGEVVGAVIKWAAESRAIEGALRVIGEVIGFIADHFREFTQAAEAILSPSSAANSAIARQLETSAAAHKQSIDSAASTGALVAQYRALAAELESGKLKGEAKTAVLAQLKAVTDELTKISPAYRDALTSETGKIGEQAAALEKLQQAKLLDLGAKRDAAFAAEAPLKEQAVALERQLADAVTARNAATGRSADAAQGEVARISGQLDSTKQKLQSARDEAGLYATAIEKAVEATVPAGASSLATLTRKHTDEPKPVKGLAGAEANAEIERIKAEAATIERALEGQLQRNEISYADYFARLNAIELTALDVQIAAKQAQLEKTKDPKERLKLGADIAKLQDEETQVVEKNAEKRLKLEEQYDKQRTALAVQQLKDQGQAELAFDLQFEEAHRALRARATAENDAATLKAIDNAYDVGKAKLLADRATTDARGVTSDTEGTVRGTQASVEAGAISEARGREIIIAAYQRERAAIVAALDAAEALAKVSATPENIAKVDQLAKQYGAVEQQIARASDTSLHLRAAIASVVSSDVARYFTDTIQHVHSLGDAFTGLARTVVKSLSDIIAKILEAAIASKISGFLTGILGGGSLGSALLGDISNAGVAHAASGGHITGGGGPTTDSIPAMLSNGEYVVRASAVDRMGVGFFDAVNAGSLRGTSAHAYGGIVGYATGGMVRHYASGGSVGSEPGAGPSSTLHVTHDPSLILEAVRSDAGHKIILEAIQRNSKAVGQLLGARR